jgi:hypothetical protein
MAYDPNLALRFARRVLPDRRGIPLRARLDEMLCPPGHDGSWVSSAAAAATTAHALADSPAAAVPARTGSTPGAPGSRAGTRPGTNGHRTGAGGPDVIGFALTEAPPVGPPPAPSPVPTPGRIVGSTTTPTRGREWVRNQGVSVSTVRTTAALRDELVRCYAVARGYERLSRELGERVLGTTDANWATWATWATYSVSSTLDEQQTPLALSLLFDRLHLPQFVRGRLHQLYLWASVHVNELQRIGLSRGNIDVYAQIGCDLARFLDLYADPDGPPTAARLDEFLLSVTAPPARADLVARLPMLHEGFRCYHRAAATSTPRERSEQVLAGNLYIATYEQVQLQPYLDEVLFLAPTAPMSLRNTARRHLGPRVARLMTRYLVNVSLPDEVIWASKGVPVRRGDPGPGLFPASLAVLASPLAQSAFDMWDRADGSTAGTIVTDWADLADRMNFAVNILRSRQQDPSLFDSPFTPEVGALLDGVLEDGRITGPTVALIEQEARVLPKRAAREGRATTATGRPLGPGGPP